MKAKIVYPGEMVAVSEEYLAGQGTYEADGDIYAAQIGELLLDAREKVASVKSLNPPIEQKVGDTVLATVQDIKQTMAIVHVEAVEGIERQVTGDVDGTIHISKVSEQYTEDLKKAMRIGDVVRARVVQVKPSLQLATNEASLGVVRGLCTRCRYTLIVRGRDLYCEHCERTEPRKVASVYQDLMS